MFLGIAVGLIATQEAARAGAMSSWQGATASAYALDNSSPKSQGATAFASTSGSDVVPLQGWNGAFQLTGTASGAGSASAAATGNPSDLLEVKSTLGTSSPGTTGGLPFSTGGVSATANWSNDSVIVQAPQGLALPSDIRLQFTLTFNPQWTFGGAWANQQYGTNTLSIDNHPFTVGNTGATLPFDSLITNYLKDSYGNATSAFNSQTGTFHLDVGLTKSGVSDPFSLSLQTMNPGAILSNTATYITQDLKLSLTGVTTANGTPLQSLGDSVSFASGMVAPVPEPATMAAWGLVTAACGLASLRSRWRNLRRPALMVAVRSHMIPEVALVVVGGVGPVAVGLLLGDEAPHLIEPDFAGPGGGRATRSSWRLRAWSPASRL